MEHKALILKTYKIFFTSDTHFGSERILSLSRRPFKTVKEKLTVDIKEKICYNRDNG